MTAMLAIAMHKQGLAVGVLDADVYGPSIRRLLPEDRLPRQNGERIVPAEARGIKTMSIAYYRPSARANAIRGPIAHGLIKQFIHQVDWGELDVLLVDFPPGTGDVPMSLCQELELEGAVVVTTPQEIALLDVRKAVAFFDQMGVSVLGIIENMTHLVGQPDVKPFGSGGGELLAKQMGVPLMEQIPLDPELGRQCDAGALVSNPLFEGIANQMVEVHA